MATGDFSYVNASGDDFTLRDPPSGERFMLVGGAMHVLNQTNASATLGSAAGRAGSQLVVYPGASGSFGGAVVPDLVIFD
ncbi:hypothetical protein ACLMAL_25045 [Nocardia sp. CWNU-33]|uniref:hypothetical protein n=1 Tax=Nocardia sp. CWNU-33 TaxID=3392117 RepID=UPI00398E3DCD